MAFWLFVDSYSLMEAEIQKLNSKTISSSINKFKFTNNQQRTTNND